MVSFSHDASGLHRAVTNGDYVTAIMMAKSAAKRTIDIDALGGRLENSEMFQLKQAGEVMRADASVTSAAACTFMEFFRITFARFSPMHQRAATLPIFFHTHSAWNTANAPDSAAADDCTTLHEPWLTTDALAVQNHAEQSPLAHRIHAQMTKMHDSKPFPANMLPCALPNYNLNRSFLIRVFREKRKFQRRFIGWTTLTYTLTLHHRTCALRCSSLFSTLALRLCTPSPTPSSPPRSVSPSSVAIMRHLRRRCHSQVTCNMPATHHISILSATHHISILSRTPQRAFHAARPPHLEIARYARAPLRVQLKSFLFHSCSCIGQSNTPCDRELRTLWCSA